MKRILLRKLLGQSFVVTHPESIEDKERRKDVEQLGEEVAKDRDEDKMVVLAPGTENVANIIKTAIIVKEDDGYYVKSEKKDNKGHRKNLGGPYTSRERAEKRLRDVEMFKHMGGRIIKALPVYDWEVEKEKVRKQKQNFPAIQEHEDYFLGEEHENYPRIVGSFLQIGCKDE